MGRQSMDRNRPRSFRELMVGCATSQRINRETGAGSRAECNARGSVVGRKSETRFQNDTNPSGGVNAISGILGRITLRCGKTDFRRVWRETNPGDASGLYRPATAITGKISSRQDLRASVAPARRLDLEYNQIKRRFRPD